MLFTEPLFIVFFLCVFVVHWTLQGHEVRKFFLLAASYVFYSAWDWRFCSLIMISTVIDFVVGGYLGRNPVSPRRRLVLIVSLVANLGILGFFKYFNFFVESANSLLGIESGRTLYIILPVGISFFTFQSMSYTIDIYRKKMKPVARFTDFALFVSFFPQLVAGPIVRAEQFLPQLETRKRFGQIAFQSALMLFLIGFIKKACISDNIAPIIDPVFANPEQYTALSTWIATLFYAVQIYCDFSGYTDMAIAAAALLGYTLTLNFNFPYFASNIAQFWQRWHISLSSWLRDYLYISMGGNRAGQFKLYRNLMITMLLGGLWHGAAWTFVTWGALHGIALVAHRYVSERLAIPEAIGKSLGIVATMYWVCLAWIFFRCTSMSNALTMAKAYVTFQSPGEIALDGILLLWLIPLVVAHWVASRVDLPEKSKGIPDWAFSAGLGVAIVAALLFVPQHTKPFIYFQF